MGEPGLFSLLEAFYKKLANSDVQRFFPEDEAELLVASQKSAAFFIQVMGGRPLFSQHFGPPRMRMRHFPFEIDAAARQTWLDCFYQTVDELVAAGEFPAEHRVNFCSFLDSFSSWMVNVEPS
jgi:hemoglobin